MAITYPVSFPTVSGVENIQLYADHATAVSTSPFTFQTQAQSYSGQRWRASVSIPPLPREDAEMWVSFLLKMKGRYGTFLMGDPSGVTARGAVSGTPLVDGGGQSGGDLNIKGGTASVSNWIRAGDYIQLGSGSTAQLYKVLNNESTSGTGTVSVEIWPNLRSSPADNAPIVVSNTVGRWRLSDNTSAWDINNATFYGISFDCEEAL